MLRMLQQSSLYQEKIPMEWKMAHVTAIFKKRSTVYDDSNSYRTTVYDDSNSYRTTVQAKRNAPTYLGYLVATNCMQCFLYGPISCKLNSQLNSRSVSFGLYCISLTSNFCKILEHIIFSKVIMRDHVGRNHLVRQAACIASQIPRFSIANLN